MGSHRRGRHWGHTKTPKKASKLPSGRTWDNFRHDFADLSQALDSSFHFRTFLPIWGLRAKGGGKSPNKRPYFSRSHICVVHSDDPLWGPKACGLTLGQFLFILRPYFEVLWALIFLVAPSHPLSLLAFYCLVGISKSPTKS